MLLRAVKLKNILSFKDTELELGPLNVLIGPNASGKSNLIDVIGLLRAAPTNLSLAILNGGGIRAWTWKGGTAPSGPIAAVECAIAAEPGSIPLSYTLEFSEDVQGFVIVEESLQDATSGPEGAEPKVHFHRQVGGVVFGRSLPAEAAAVGEISRSESVLARFKSPIDPTPITRLGRRFEQIRIYPEFNTGPRAQARFGIAATVGLKEFLDDSGDNLALVLNEMSFNRSIRRATQYLARLSERFEEILVRVDAGIAQTYVREQGLFEPISAVRLSDGTLKFLCLMAVLLHPKPPALVCLEEPEIGLHPEALQIVGEALLEASERMQLVVSTHSDALVDALSEVPESVVVCERDFDHSTSFRRLDRNSLEAWLERYRLGELWRKGEIGGTRW